MIFDLVLRCENNVRRALDSAASRAMIFSTSRTTQQRDSRHDGVPDAVDLTCRDRHDVLMFRNTTVSIATATPAWRSRNRRRSSRRYRTMKD
jgi:hypothetical protein